MGIVALPPHTPRQLRKALANQPSVRTRIARGWMCLGGLGLLFVGGLAISHYVYGTSIQNSNTGQLATPGEILTVLLMLGGGFALFLVMGIVLHRWKPS